MLVRDQDTRESAPQAMFDRVSSLGVKYSEALSWFQPELLAMPAETLQSWCRANPKLAVYEHAFDDVLRQRRHVLNAREEELLAMGGKLAQAPRNVFTMLTNADMKFPIIKDAEGNDVELSEGRYSLYMQSSDRGLRRRAFAGTLGAYLAFKNTIAATLAGSIQKDVFYARTHNYDSALHAALDPDNVPVAVYDNLIATIRQHLPKLHRYMEIRRRKLGIDQVHIYDTFVPLVDAEAPKIGYDDAVAKIIEGLAPMGDEYLDPMSKGFASRWIDVHETQGKRSGAYSMGIYAVHPYILLNYNDTYNEMFTVAHEMGHSMHSWFTQHNQPPVYGDYPIFLAEVASTANEIALGDHLRKGAADKAEKLFLVNLAVESIRGTVINQTMWAEFEKLTHAAAEGAEPLTYETLSVMYRGLVKEYFGPSFGYDQEVDGYWLRIPHFYRGFYVYKYATSYCASTALATRILNNEPGALQAYRNFLEAGSSDYPIEILKQAGVDMSTPQPIHDTMELFGQLLDELETLLQS
jgi:oligoendopeptidase F